MKCGVIVVVVMVLGRETMKVTLFYVNAIIAFVLTNVLLRHWVSEPFAIGIAAFAMMLVGYPAQRAMTSAKVSLGRWALFSFLGAIAGTIVSVIIFRTL